MSTRIIVDSSVWIEHFRRRNTRLLELLKDHRVVTHELLVGELRCGTPPSPRAASMCFLADLLRIRPVELDEVLALVEDQKIYGQGCGLVDIAVLVATLRTPETKLWSRDKKMQRVATMLGIPLLDNDPAREESDQRADVTAACPIA